MNNDVGRPRQEAFSQSIDNFDRHPESAKSVFDGFLADLRKRGIRVSTPEWLQFLSVVKTQMKEVPLAHATNNQELFERLRVYARVTLVKNKADEAAFNEAFDHYFSDIASVIEEAVGSQEKQQDPPPDDEPEEEQDEPEQEEETTSEEPDLKEKLGIEEVDENLDLPHNGEHDDNEQVHGGKKDQHNDILRQKDKSKKGGGAEKPQEEKQSEGQPTGGNPQGGEAEEFQEVGVAKGTGKGRSREAIRVPQGADEGLTRQYAKNRAEQVASYDRRNKYERRPGRADIRQIVRDLRRIIADTSKVPTREIDIAHTIQRFARLDFGIDYKREREKQPQIVLFIDVGGPVDEWSPLIREVAQEMTKGLTKLEIYLFHNNLYGYVWKLDPKNPERSNFAKPDSLIDIRTIIKRKKKVIIYGDAEMSATEFDEDFYPPRENEERVAKFRMKGEDCLRFIQRKAEAVVWINPVFAKEWRIRDDSGTISQAKGIISMHDLSVGGVQDAIRELMKR